jgi:hypothetical protein
LCNAQLRDRGLTGACRASAHRFFAREFRRVRG